MAAHLPVYVVDSFTDSPFAGNPAGVVLLDGPRKNDWMQSVAAELKHSETAFLEPLPAPSVDPAPIGLRWFTPTVEVDLCGHATLAGAHVLYGRGYSGVLAFDTRSGRLAAQPGPGASIVLDFPARPPTTPDIAQLSTMDARGIVVTARADVTSDYDVVTRFFAPRARHRGGSGDRERAHCCGAVLVPATGSDRTGRLSGVDKGWADPHAGGRRSGPARRACGHRPRGDSARLIRRSATMS